MNIARHESGEILTQVVEANGLVFTSGVLPANVDVGVKEQTSQVLAEIDRLLALANTSKSKIVSVSIWVTDIRLRDPMNEAWLSWLDRQNIPARVCIESKLADPKALVEISVIATQ